MLCWAFNGFKSCHLWLPIDDTEFQKEEQDSVFTGSTGCSLVNTDEHEGYNQRDAAGSLWNGYATFQFGGFFSQFWYTRTVTPTLTTVLRIIWRTNTPSTKAGSEPINKRPYRCPHFQKTEIENIVAELLQHGVIQHSTSPFTSLVILVKKKDGTWRMYIATESSTITIKDKFPIPVIDELLDELHGAK